MELEVKRPQTINVKTLKIHVKVSDRFNGTLVSDKGEEIHEFDGYVPGFMPGEHYGDYIILDIDIDTGQVTNWPKLKPNDIEAFINGEEED